MTTTSSFKSPALPAPAASLVRSPVVLIAGLLELSGSHATLSRPTRTRAPAGLLVNDVGVMAEVHPGRGQRPDPADGGLPGGPVGGLAGWQLLVQRPGVLARRVGGVPDQQVAR